MKIIQHNLVPKAFYFTLYASNDYFSIVFRKFQKVAGKKLQEICQNNILPKSLLDKKAILQFKTHTVCLFCNCQMNLLDQLTILSENLHDVTVTFRH